MDLRAWLTFAKAQLQALFSLPTGPKTRAPRGRPGLIPIRKTVRRDGAVYQQTYYVRPENLIRHQKPKDVPPLAALMEAERTPAPKPKASSKPAEPPLVALLNAKASAKKSTPKPTPQPTEPKSPVEALYREVPELRPDVREPRTLDEAREYLLHTLIGKLNAEVAHPEGGRAGMTTMSDPHLEAWRIYHERKDEAEASVAREMAGKARNALALRDKLKRVKDAKRRWELEYEFRRNANDVAHLDRILRHLKAIRMALGDNPQAFYRELGQRTTKELQTLHKRISAKGERLWERVAPKLRRVLETALGARSLEAGGPVGGTLRALYDLLSDPTIARGKDRILPRLELAEHHLKRAAELWREYEARPSPKTLRYLLQAVANLPTYYSPEALIDEFKRALPLPSERPRWLTAWERKARRLIGDFPITPDEQSAAHRVATDLEWLEDHFRKIQGKDPGSYDVIHGNHLLHYLRVEHGDTLAKAIAILQGFLAKAEVRNIPVGRLKWVDRPRERSKVPASHFLMPKKRKFPYKNKDGSINCRLLRAAISRAAQHGYEEVEAKARRLYQRHCQG